MGEFNTDDYADSDQSFILFSLFYAACMLFIVHMLNMLIAMMGETQGNVTSNLLTTTLREKLVTIEDNKWLMKSKRHLKIKYIIAAIKVQNLDEDQQRIEQLNNKVEKLEETIAE